MALQVVISAGASPVTVGTPANLSAVLESDDPAQPVQVIARWSWQRKAHPGGDWEPIAGRTGPELVDSPGVGTWKYRAAPLSADGTAYVQMRDVEPAVVEISGVDGATPAAQTEPLRFHPIFAGTIAIVLAALVAAFVVLSGLLNLTVPLTGEAAKADPRAALAAAVIGPVMVLGLGVLALGAWMVLNEWYGAFVAPKPNASDVTKKSSVVEAISALKDLKGSSLVFIGGIALVLSVTWMVSATASGESPDPASTPTAPASVEPAPTDTGDTEPSPTVTP